jgi:hypothetical protein
MQIKVHISDNFAYGMSLAFYIAEDRPDGRYLYQFGSDGLLSLNPVTEPGVQLKPTFALEDSVARALLDALTRYFHGAEDTRQLRKDYEHEKSRVDKLIDNLMVGGE